jgi:hypothetical protein
VPYAVNVFRMCSAHTVRPHAQWHKITVKILNYDITFCLGGLADYQNRENTDVSVANTVSLFHTNVNI